ncbi:ABC transporter ATP-binding protein [Staphylococcus chromogenes]|nr:ABC transporter ATP-binding protein [Staphylococcus chromogenes]
MSHRLRVTNVSCAIKDHTVVSGVTFEVPAGSSCAIVGVNGSGKTTLLRALSGVTQPATGEVLIDDHRLHRLRPKQRARLLALVGQEEVLQPDLTVAEVVALGRLPYARAWELGGKATQAYVEKALRQVHMYEYRDRVCEQLSGGQRRLVILARALAQDTGLIVLDEPTNHLDVKHQLGLLDILLETGKTVIASVHDLDLALSRFDNVVLLANHTMAACGPSHEVLTPKRLAEHFSVHGFVVQPAECEHRHLIIDHTIADKLGKGDCH